MRTTYRVLAYLVVVGVAVQAASIAYAMFVIGHAVFEDGKTVDKSSDLGSVGFAVHGIDGQTVIPLIAIILLVVAVITRFDGAVRWAVYVLVAVIVQVVLGLVGDELPALGILHGLNALVVFALAAMAGYRVPRPGRRTSPSTGGNRKKP